MKNKKDKITPQKIVDILTDQILSDSRWKTIENRHDISRQSVYTHQKNNPEIWEAETDRLFVKWIPEIRHLISRRGDSIETPWYKSDTDSAIAAAELELADVNRLQGVLKRYIKHLQAKGAKT